jgi:hypothetical protein
VTDLDPVMVGEPLWTLQKDGHSAEARVRAIPDYGLELRFSIDGELYYSHRFTAWEPLEQAAREQIRVSGISDGDDAVRCVKSDVLVRESIEFGAGSGDQAIGHLKREPLRGLSDDQSHDRTILKDGR